MQLGHDVRRLGHGSNDVVGEVARMRTGEAHPLEALDAPTGTQQVSESASVTKLDPVGIDVLPQKCHLDDALGDERLDLGEDLAWPAVLLLAPKRRHDAEGAGVVAPDADGHPRGVRRLPAGGQRRGEDLEALQDLDLGLLGDARALEEGGERAEIVGTEDDIDPGRAADHLSAILLGKAAADGDLHARGAGLDGREVTEVAVEPVVSVLAHRARVEDDQIGLLPVGHGCIAG